MVRQTSLEVYQKIKSDGTLSRLRFEVYHCLYNNGPLTAGECWSRFFKNERQRSSISARMSELEERGVVANVGERECGYTGNLSIVWDVTNKLPIKITDKKPSRAQTIKELTRKLSDAEEQIRILTRFIEQQRYGTPPTSVRF